MEWNEKCKSIKKGKKERKKNNVHPTNWPTKKSYIATPLFGGLLFLLHIIQALSLESFGACASASGCKYLNIDVNAFSSYRKRKCLLFPLDQSLVRPFSSFSLKLSPVQIQPILVSIVVNSIRYLCQRGAENIDRINWFIQSIKEQPTKKQD